MEGFDIKEELKKLPAKPGVYIMHDKRDTIIYVGKAIILKNRVRSYFRQSTKKTPKIQEMVKRIDYFEYIVTDSELEALVLECNLIKEHRPKYNTMLKDDKTYPYIKLTITEKYPRLIFSRQMKRDKNKYFGPFTSAGAVKDTIELITKIYSLRTCNKDLTKRDSSERCCLNYHIHRCKGPCQGYCSPEEYAEGVKGAQEFLNGNYSPVIKYVEERMYEASERLDYEKAMEYKELLGSVKAIAQKQKITSSGGEDRDVIACAFDETDAVVQVFFVRDGRMIGREHFFMKNVEGLINGELPDSEENEIADDTDNNVVNDSVSVSDKIGTDEEIDNIRDISESEVSENDVLIENRNQGIRARILEIFIQQFYSGTPFVPRELLLQADIEGTALIEEWLSKKRGTKVTIRVPQKGMKERFIELAEENARIVLSQDKEKIKRQEGRTIGAAKEIAELIGIEKADRMEAFDISHISGYETVGSMVVFEKGKAKKSDYRRFKLKTVVGPDDYASMEEVLTRRFRHGMEELSIEGKDADIGSFTRFPDVIMMDGGRGQVNICLKVLENLGLSIPVCGMVKDDHHRTRGLYYNNVEIPIDIHSEGFKLITRLQDEAHRFAIEFHRSLRSKEQMKSVLDDIPGIGPKRRIQLLRRFGSIEGIAAADIEELSACDSMNEEAARAVKEFFEK